MEKPQPFFESPISRRTLLALVSSSLLAGSCGDQPGILSLVDETIPVCRDASHSCLILRTTFNHHPVGPYTCEQLAADWNNPPFSHGIMEGRVAIALDIQDVRNRVLRVLYPASAVGPEESGTQWIVRFDNSYDELYISYWVRFEENFDFSKGGKLPGLAGGQGNTGGKKPTGEDGFSARIVWLEEGKIAQYVYYPDQASNFGDKFIWMNGRAHFSPGVWHRVMTRIAMNTPGEHNGIVQSWLDGVLTLDIENIRFRDTPRFAIDQLRFETFPGGRDPDSFGPSKDQTIDFDHVMISTESL